MTLKDEQRLIYYPKVSPILRVAIYESNLSKNSAEYRESHFDVLPDDDSALRAASPIIHPHQVQPAIIDKGVGLIKPE